MKLLDPSFTVFPIWAWTFEHFELIFSKIGKEEQLAETEKLCASISSATVVQWSRAQLISQEVLGLISEEKITIEQSYMVVRLRFFLTNI